MASAAFSHPYGFPSIVLPAFGAHGRPFGIAVVVSLVIHGIAFGWLPGLKGSVTALAQPLQIVLPRPPEEPKRVAAPVPPTSEPTPRANRREGEPPTRPLQHLLTSPVQQSGQETLVVHSSEPVRAASDESIRPNPVRSDVPSIGSEAGDLTAYGRALAGAVATRQRYPRVAQLRQWQGTAVLQLELASDGRLVNVRVLSSSGHEILDRQALEMVREAVPLPPLPAALAGRQLTVDVPVVFRLSS